MGNPCNDGPATAAPRPHQIDNDKITIKGSIPPEFRKALDEFRQKSPSVERTTVNFYGNCKGLENIYALSPEKEAERRAQKCGERRHPDVKIVPCPAPAAIDWDTPIPMGMGKHPFASPAAVIPRVFRFTVHTDLNDNFQYYVQDMDIDWVAKQIKMTLYETTAFDVDDVMRAYSSEKNKHTLTVMLYDGCGNKIMGYRFHGVACHTYSSRLDYSKSDPLSPKAVLQFKSVEQLKRPAK